MFLKHNIPGLSLLPMENWGRCFEEKKPIGSVLGREVFLWQDNSDRDNVCIRVGDSGATGISVGNEIPTDLEVVLQWFLIQIRAEINRINFIFNTLDSIRLYGETDVPLPPVVRNLGGPKSVIS